MTQTEFAQRIGISGDYLKKIENGVRKFPPKIAKVIQHETGVLLLKGKLRNLSGGAYSKLDYIHWKQIHAKQDDKLARRRALDVAPWIEILFRAAAQPQRRRFWQVWARLIQALDECREDFNLTSATDDLVREYAPPTSKVMHSDVKQLRQLGWKKKDLPQVGEQISLIWSPGSDALTPAWLTNVRLARE